MQKDLRAALTVVLGYVPTVKEVRQALGRPEDGPNGLSRSTHADWQRSGRDRTLDSIYCVALYYEGREAFDGTILTLEDVRFRLEIELGYRSENAEDESVEQGENDP